MKFWLHLGKKCCRRSDPLILYVDRNDPRRICALEKRAVWSTPAAWRSPLQACQLVKKHASATGPQRATRPTLACALPQGGSQLVKSQMVRGGSARPTALTKRGPVGERLLTEMTQRLSFRKRQFQPRLRRMIEFYKQLHVLAVDTKYLSCDLLTL